MSGGWFGAAVGWLVSQLGRANTNEVSLTIQNSLKLSVSNGFVVSNNLTQKINTSQFQLCHFIINCDDISNVTINCTNTLWTDIEQFHQTDENFSASVINDLQQSVINDIDQDVQNISDGIGAFLQFLQGKTNQYASLTNAIQTSVQNQFTFENINTQQQSLLDYQSGNITLNCSSIQNSVLNITNDIHTKLVMQNLLDETIQVAIDNIISQNLDTQFTQSQTTKTTLFSTTTIIAIIVIAIVIIVVLVVGAVIVWLVWRSISRAKKTAFSSLLGGGPPIGPPTL